MGFNIQKAKQAGYTDQEINDYLKSQQSSPAFTAAKNNAQAQQPSLGGASDLLRTLGLGAVPDTLGGLQNAAGATAQGILKLIGSNKQVQNNNDFMNPQQQQSWSTPGGAALNVGKDAAGLASWAVPETKVFQGGNVLTKLLAGAGNKAIQGALQGVGGAVASGQNPLTGGAQGAITNPIMGAAGHLATDVLPRYIGLRNFGVAGLKLPEVVKGENAAANVGNTLEDARSAAMKPLENATLSRDVPNQIIDKLAEKYKGVEGLGHEIEFLKGEIASPNNGLHDIWQLANNRAYSKAEQGQNKLAKFQRQVAHDFREEVISRSADPEKARQAMDLYATQTAMNASKEGIGGNKVTNMLGNLARGGGGEIGLTALLSAIPALSGLAPLAAMDTALTNSVTGPTTARGLVNSGGSPIGDLLKRLGIGGVQALASPDASQ